MRIEETMTMGTDDADDQTDDGDRFDSKGEQGGGDVVVVEPNPTTHHPTASDGDKNISTTTTSSSSSILTENIGVCCFHLKFGTCNPPRPPCRWRHVDVDDGQVICAFGATCRLGHARRVLDRFCQEAVDGVKGNGDDNGNGTGSGKRSNSTSINKQQKQQQARYWHQFNQRQAIVGANPAARDATLLQAQLEPYRTAALRARLHHVFGEARDDPRALEFVGRAEIMRRLLEHYQQKHCAEQAGNDNHSHHGGGRPTIHARGALIRNRALLRDTWAELQRFRQLHRNNARPALKAQAYLVLHPPENTDGNNNDKNGTTTTTRKGQRKAKKRRQFQRLWECAIQLLTDTLVDEPMTETETENDNSNNNNDNSTTQSNSSIQRFCQHELTAVAVTYNFVGSPHIDKQDTGPFYGVSLSNLPNDDNDNDDKDNWEEDWSSSNPYGDGSVGVNERGDDKINGKDNAETTSNNNEPSSSTNNNDKDGGKLCVEVDAMTVAVLDTQNRIVQVDGRYPHWVVPYDTERYDRFSLIYYSTNEKKNKKKKGSNNSQSATDQDSIEQQQPEGEPPEQAAQQEQERSSPGRNNGGYQAPTRAFWIPRAKDG